MVAKHSGGARSGTNNQAELMAVVVALENLPAGVRARIVSDSQYVVKGATDWIFKWEAKDYAGVKNAELWRRIRELTRFREVGFAWVRGHAGNRFNELADELAGAEAARYALQAA